MAALGGGEDVSYRWTEGESRTYERTLELEGVNPEGTKGRIVQTVRTTEKAVEVTGREAIATEVTLDRIAMDIYRDGPQPVLHMDSAEPAPPAPPGGAAEATGEAANFARVTAPLRRLAGLTCRILARPSGKIERIDGTEGFGARMTEGLPADDPMRAVVARMNWPAWYATLMAPAVGAPDRSCKVGEGGKYVDLRMLPETTGVPGYLYYAGTYRLAELKDGVVRLTAEGQVSLDPIGSMPPWPSALAPFRPRLRLERGVSTGWARIRAETGVLEEDEQVTDLDLHFVKPDGSGEAPIPTRITRRTRLLK